MKNEQNIKKKTEKCKVEKKTKHKIINKKRQTSVTCIKRLSFDGWVETKARTETYEGQWVGWVHGWARNRWQLVVGQTA